MCVEVMDDSQLFYDNATGLRSNKSYWTAAVALGVLVLLLGAYEMRKHVPKQPNSRSAVVHAVDDLEISRHRHDGAQPETENVRPGQRTTVTWEPRL
jgi:hypothetical protein